MLKERYENRTNGKNAGRIAVVERVDDAAKTAVLVYEDGNGGCKVTFATLKRWWKKVKDADPVVEKEPEVVVEQPVVEQEVVDSDDTASDGTPYAEVMQEIVQDGKKAAKAAAKKPSKKKEKVVPEGWVEDCKNFIFDIVTGYGDEVFVPATDIKMRTFKTGGHMYAKLNYSSKSITLAVQGASVKNAEPVKKVNHMFDYCFIFKQDFSSDDKKLISELLSDARNYRIFKNNKSKTKKEEN